MHSGGATGAGAISSEGTQDTRAGEEGSPSDSLLQGSGFRGFRQKS